MAKEVILMASVTGLGAEGDVVKVADGYARNYLLPRKLAAPVTQATRRQLEKKRVDREADDVKQRGAAQEVASRIEQMSLTIPVKTGPEGKLFGSVQTQDILNALKDQGVTLKKSNIDLPEGIKELGVFTVPVKLQQDTATTLKVWVVEE